MHSSPSTRRERRRPRPLLLERLECRLNPGFVAPLAFDAGSFPSSVAVGDFNGGGLLDLAVANRDSNDVSVLLGNGDGSFQAARHFPAGSGPRSVAVGEFNGDGRLDLAVANYGRIIRVLLGHGDGTFQAPLVSYVAGADPIFVAVGEFNGDGRQDLVTANQYNDNVSVLVGHGDGTFQAAQNFPAGGEPHSVAVGEFNGDGRLDLAVANYSSNDVSVLWGNGDGTFQAAQNFPAGRQPQFVAVGDVNGDGRQDLALMSGTVRVLLGNGDGTFQTTHVSYVAGGRPVSVAVADLDGDGWLDLVTANSSSHDVSVLRNDGYWGGPAVYFWVYPFEGTVTAGQPFDFYVIPLNASYEIVTNYTGQIVFYATDPLATTPVYYQFRLSDHGIAAFPGGLTFNTVGVQELYVFDWPAIRVWGYAAFDVVGAGPSSGGGASVPAFDLFAGQESARDRGRPALPLPGQVAVSSIEQQADSVPAEQQRPPLVTAGARPAARLDRGGAAHGAILDRLYAKLDEQW